MAKLQTTSEPKRRQYFDSYKFMLTFLGIPIGRDVTMWYWIKHGLHFAFVISYITVQIISCIHAWKWRKTVKLFDLFNYQFSATAGKLL